VLAVLVTRWLDNKRRASDRRLDTFRALMASRRVLLSPDKVRALNLVEIDFYGIKPVEDAYREVMTHINTPQPVPAGWDDRHRKLLTKLLSEMAKVLSYTSANLLPNPSRSRSQQGRPILPKQPQNKLDLAFVAIVCSNAPANRVAARQRSWLEPSEPLARTFRCLGRTIGTS